MRKPQRKQRKPARKAKAREPKLGYVVGDDGCWELPPKRKPRDKSRPGT